MSKVRVFSVASQKLVLRELAELVEKSTVDPIVRNAALAITSDVDQRDDEGEVQAIFNAVKYGDARVAGLERGLKYMSDPRWADFFTAPSRMLKQMAASPDLAAEDCDGHSMLIAALLGSLGFIVGLRAWGRTKGEYDHVYAMVALPKNDPKEEAGLDTTVDESVVGWEPPGGRTLTAWLDGQ